MPEFVITSFEPSSDDGSWTRKKTYRFQERSVFRALDSQRIPERELEFIRIHVHPAEGEHEHVFQWHDRTAFYRCTICGGRRNWCANCHQPLTTVRDDLDPTLEYCADTQSCKKRGGGNPFKGLL
jgi:hypothetical protein